MLLRGSSHSNVHRLFPFTGRHFTAVAGPSAADRWVSKTLATLFFLSPNPPALLLASFNEVLTPSIAFSALRRLSDPKTALNFFKTIQNDLKISHLADSYHLLIGILCRAELLEEAFEMFDEMCSRNHSFDASFVGLLVDSCAGSDRLDSSMKMLSRASAEFGFRLRAFHFNNVMTRLVTRNRAKDAIFFFEEQLRFRAFDPDTCSFNIVIKGLCVMGDVGRAFVLYRNMGSFRCVPDTVTKNILVDGLCRTNRIDDAYEFLRRIRTDGVCLPNVVTYTSVISGYCKTSMMENALEVFDEMIGFGIKPSRVTYNVLIDGYGKTNNMKMAVSIYERMVLGGCQPDVVSFTSLIDGYCRCQKLADALKLWHELHKRGLRSNVYTFSVIINSLCRMNRLSDARELLNELNGRNDIAPHAFIYNPVIDGLCKAGNVDDANKIMMEMEDKGCSPDKYTYNILIIGHCMKGRMLEAISLFNRMVNSRCPPDDVIFRCLSSCLLKAGMPGAANRVLLMRRRNKSGNISSSLETSPSVPVAA